MSPSVRRVACYVAFDSDGILGAASAEPEPAWPRAVALALVHAVPYLFRCRAVMLSCGWIFGRVGWAWLPPVRRMFLYVLCWGIGYPYGPTERC